MKPIWKKLSAGLLAFALVFTTIPPIGASADTTALGTDTGEKEEYVIDVSEADQVSLPAQGLDVVYVLTGTNTAATVYINADCELILRNVTLKKIYTDSDKNLTVNITLEGENVIDQNVSQSEGAIEVRRSQVTINGGEDDSLHAKSRKFPAYSIRDEVKAGGGLTINGGNITFEMTDSGVPIQTAYTQNGGTVKVIGSTSSCFLYNVYLNGGSLEVNHQANNSVIFNNPVKIKNGASMKVTGPETPGQNFSFNGPLGLADGAAADDCLLVRFDDSSDFVYLDEGNEILRGKTYAEIKAVTHVHEYENGICSCNYSCVHNTDDGTCSLCEAYIYKIKHQPTVEEPYVALNDGTGASYQWYEVKNISEITDESKIYPWSYFGEPFEEDSTYDAAAGWTPIDDSYEGDSYKYLYYIASSFKAVDQVTLRFSSPVEYAVIFNQNDELLCEVDGTTATATIPSDGVFGICATTKDTEPTVKVYVGDAEVNALTGQTSATLRQYAYGNYYFCKATAKDGTVLTSDYADFTYKITHQPTDEAQYVSLNNSKNATYQWYIAKGDIVQVTEENSHGWSVFDAPEYIGGTYDSETGWTPDEYGDYFVVWLDEGDVVNFEFSQTPSEWGYLFSTTEGAIEDEANIESDASLTAEASGYYGIWAVDGGNLKATMDGTEFIAVSGQTDATLNASELGQYRCEVTFGNGTKVTSDIVEVQHLHAGGMATCKDKAICITCGIGYGSLSTEHKYDNACDTECNVCRTTRTVTHNYNEATCTDPKTCKICGNEEGEALGHTPGPEATSTTPQICTVCLSVLAPATGTTPTPDPETGDGGSTAGGTTPDPGVTPTPTPDPEPGDGGSTGGGTTPDPGVTPTPNPDPGTGTIPEPGSGTTPTPDPGVTPTPTPDPDTGTIPEPGSGTTPTPDPGVTPTPTPDPELEHQCTYKTATTKATASKNGKIVTKCTVCGTVKSTTTIYKASGVKLKVASYAYNGKVKNPTVIVKDSKGKTIAKSNYKITKPTGRKAIGKYTYIIKFKGTKYTGTKKLTLTIKPVKPTIQTPKAAKKAITVKWKKGKKAQVTGYQVMAATNSKFTKNKKTATVKGYTKVSRKMTGLKAKTKYYVKVRTYKTVKGVKIYSNWSKVKSVKVK
ncbi:MAG: hypothetical protein IKJ77_05730 [Firmicutes bacterium]|nr:hypothetical protein [Bacillota bacterium]